MDQESSNAHTIESTIMAAASGRCLSEKVEQWKLLCFTFLYNEKNLEFFREDWSEIENNANNFMICTVLLRYNYAIDKHRQSTTSA